MTEAGEARATRAQATLDSADHREEEQERALLERLDAVLKLAESRQDLKGFAALSRELRGMWEFQTKRRSGGFRPPGAPQVNVQINQGLGSDAEDLTPEELASEIRTCLLSGIMAPGELRAIAAELELEGTAGVQQLSESTGGVSQLSLAQGGS